jgi:hypothetical protein
MRTTAQASIVAVALVFSAGRAAAAGYHVSPTGDDSAAGTATAPWKTLQKAAGKVAAGDTVTVADGTYAGFLCDGKKGTADARIVFKSANKWGAKITSAGTGASREDFVQLNSCSYVTVDGFEVSGAPRSGIAILGNEDDGSDARDVIIQNNHSHHNGTKIAGRHDGIFSGFALNLTIQDNEVHHAGEHGIYVSNAGDNPIIRRNHVYVTGKNCAQINADLSTGGDGLISNWLIEGNVMHECGQLAFNLDGAIRGVMQNNLVYGSMKGGIALFQGDGAESSHSNLVVNNTIYIPSGSRAALQVAGGANNNVVFNNILISQAAGLEIQDVTGLVHDYNFVSSYDGGSASAHEAKPDPAALFTDAAAGKLTLAATSPALEAGVATLGGKSAPSMDIEGKARPSGTAYDRGCYEAGKGGGSIPGADAGASTGGTDAGTKPAADGGVKDGGATNPGAAGTGGAAGTAGGGAAGTSAPNGSAGVTGGAAAGTNGSGTVTGAAGTTSSGAAGATSAPASRDSGGGCSLGSAGHAPTGWSVLAGAALLTALANRRSRRRRQN